MKSSQDIGSLQNKHITTCTTSVPIEECRLPFNIVTKPFFRSFINHLCPEYVPFVPSRAMLSGDLLDELFREMESEVEASLASVKQLGSVQEV